MPVGKGSSMSVKTYSRKEKRLSIAILLILNTAFLGVMLPPLYWFWDRIAARPPSIWAIIIGLTGYLIYTWAKFTFAMTRSLNALRER